MSVDETMYVVVCVKRVNGIPYTQVFGLYADHLTAKNDAETWDRIQGWDTQVQPVYPAATKRSLLHPTRIGRS